MHVQDLLWTRLTFLRTTRSNLEALGYALHWDAEETLAKEDVRRKEEELQSVLDPHRGMSKALTWTPAVQEALYCWWKARCSLLDASNQLGDPGRQKSTRKAMQTWIPTLIRSCFASFEVTEEEISAMVRSIDDAKTAEARRRKEGERIERNAEKAERRAKRARETELKMAQGASYGRPTKRVPPLVWKLMSSANNTNPSNTAANSSTPATNTSTAAATTSVVATNGSHVAPEPRAVNLPGPRPHPLIPVSGDAAAAVLAVSKSNPHSAARAAAVAGATEEQSTSKPVTNQTRADEIALSDALAGRGLVAPSGRMHGDDAAFEVIELD
jgi:hypothetical protein